MRWVRVCLLVVVAALGCGESVRNEGDVVECTTDLDCSDGQTCVFSREAPRDLETFWGGNAGVGAGGGAGIGQGGTSGTGSNIGGTNPGGCPSSVCGGTGCAAGLVCRSGAVPGCPNYMSCQVACGDPTATPCELGTICRSNGLCEPVRCDDADYPGCPTGMTCDPMVEPGTGLPGRYSIFGTEGYPYTDFDHGAILTNDQVAAIAARCVFLRCDQPGAFGCADAFRCDVANALPLSSGCVGIPCGELGRCSTDAFICEPTSTGPRPVTVDAHGCVEKNCEEGRPCAELYRCDAARTTNVDGCVPIRCDEPGGACVSELTKCAPDYVREQLPSGLVYAPDAFGCVYKRCDIDDFPCPAGQVCDPATSRSTDGCTAPPVPPDPGGGGTSGTAGTSGTSGTSGVAGKTGDPSPSGVCR